MDSWWGKFFVKTFLLMALMLNTELSAIIQLNVNTLAGISTKCHVPPKSWNDKGGTRRLMEVNNISCWRVHLLHVSEKD